MPLIRDGQDRFAQLIDYTAAARGLAAALVEKDYWAMTALRAVQRGFPIHIDEKPDVPIRPVFKGGTSLSKAFGLLERFSEDVDLLVPVPFETAGAFSQRQRQIAMKQVALAVSSELQIDGDRKSGRKGVDLHWNFPYVPVTQGQVQAAIEPIIRVELTVMGGPHPLQDVNVAPWIAEDAAALGLGGYDDLQPIAVRALAPERTLVEKLAMLHDAATQALDGRPDRLRQAGRHYYDIAKLLQTPAVTGSLNAAVVAQFAEDADKWSKRGGFPFTPRPPGGFATSPAFTSTQLRDEVLQSYTTAMTWVWSANKPTLDDCLAEVQQHAAIL